MTQDHQEMPRTAAPIDWNERAKFMLDWMDPRLREAVEAEAAARQVPLDVERLANALHAVDDDLQFMHRDAAQNRPGIARRIAREYALLSAGDKAEAPLTTGETNA